MEKKLTAGNHENGIREWVENGWTTIQVETAQGTNARDSAALAASHRCNYKVIYNMNATIKRGCQAQRRWPSNMLILVWTD